MRSVGERERRDPGFERPGRRVLCLVDQMAVGRGEGEGIVAGDRTVRSDKTDPAGAQTVGGDA